MSGLPGRYAGWMTRDLVTGPGVLMAVLVALALMLVRKLQVVGPGGEADMAACFVVLDWATMGLTLLATAGLVSGDFALGHQRTLFAKPVSPPLYYLQRWLCGGIAVLAGALPIAYAIAIRFDLPVLSLTLFARMALLYLVLGGLVFLLSTMTRRDWLLAIVLFATQTALGVARASGIADGPVATALHAILPPFQLVGVRGPAPAGADLVHAAGYGAALLLGALALLQWRPLARGARD
jgi:ABC-type transport system involved in multi-copper enzyme maturation permease subunit